MSIDFTNASFSTMTANTRCPAHAYKIYAAKWKEDSITEIMGKCESCDGQFLVNLPGHQPITLGTLVDRKFN